MTFWSYTTQKYGFSGKRRNVHGKNKTGKHLLTLRNATGQRVVPPSWRQSPLNVFNLNREGKRPYPQQVDTQRVADMCRFGLQNVPFRLAKRPVLQAETARFASRQHPLLKAGAATAGFSYAFATNRSVRLPPASPCCEGKRKAPRRIRRRARPKVPTSPALELPPHAGSCAAASRNKQAGVSWPCRI